MNRFLRVAVMMGTACAVPAMAQDAKKAEGQPAPNQTVVIRRAGAQGAVVVQKVEGKPIDDKDKDKDKAEAAKSGDAKAGEAVQGEVKGEVIMRANVVVQGQAVQAVEAVQVVVEGRAIDIAMPAVAIAGRQRNQANLDPLIAQFMPQMRPLLRTELHFVKTVCQPTKEQQKAIAILADKAFKDAVRTYAEAQQKMMQGQWRGNAQPDPAKALQDGMLAAVRACLPPEQAARYQHELDRRAADKKSVAIQNIVVRIDQELVLASDQREALARALDKDWKPAWGGNLESYMYGNDLLPALPQKLIEPILTPTQKKVWAGSQKASANVYFGGMNFANGAEMEADPIDEEVFAELRKVEAAEAAAAKARALSKGPPRPETIEPLEGEVNAVRGMRIIAPQ